MQGNDINKATAAHRNLTKGVPIAVRPIMYTGR